MWRGGGVAIHVHKMGQDSGATLGFAQILGFFAIAPLAFVYFSSTDNQWHSLCTWLVGICITLPLGMLSMRTFFEAYKMDRGEKERWQARQEERRQSRQDTTRDQ